MQGDFNVFRCVVETNCEKDPHQRVKVKHPNLWEDTSELIPVANGLYLDKGDIVLLVMQDYNPRTAFIMCKIPDYAQEKKNPKKSEPVIFKTQDDEAGKWIEAHGRKSEWKIESDQKMLIRGFWKDLQITTPSKTEIHIKDDYIHLKTPKGQKIIEDTDGKIVIKNTLTSLYDIMKTLRQALLNQPTTIGGPFQQTFNPAITAGITLSLEKLEMLLKG